MSFAHQRHELGSQAVLSIKLGLLGLDERCLFPMFGRRNLRAAALCRRSLLADVHVVMTIMTTHCLSGLTAHLKHI